MQEFDFAIVGAGIAGVSAAYHLAPRARVVILEREHVAAYHTTGRSAALHSETYGSAEIRAITVATGHFYRKPPPGFTDHPKVVNGASDLMVEVFGDRGKHARSAVGSGSLPLNVAVEVEAIADALYIEGFRVIDPIGPDRALIDPCAQQPDLRVAQFAHVHDHSLHRGLESCFRFFGRLHGLLFTGHEIFKEGGDIPTNPKLIKSTCKANFTGASKPGTKRLYEFVPGLVIAFNARATPRRSAPDCPEIPPPSIRAMTSYFPSAPTVRLRPRLVAHRRPIQVPSRLASTKAMTQGRDLPIC